MTARKTRKFPQNPVLIKLLAAAQQTPDTEKIVYDVFGFEKSYPELLGDIMETCDILRSQLPTSALNERGIFRDESAYVAILARSGYEFLVAFFAIQAMGGACTPLGTGILPEEAQYFLSKTKATCMLAGRDSIKKAKEICAYLHEHEGSRHLALLPIICNAEPLRSSDVEIDETLQIDPDGPGLALFTSGTTGRPKGVVLLKRLFSMTELAEPGSAAMNCRPSHWIGGTMGLVEPVITGKKLYTLGAKNEKALAEATLEAFKNHPITHALFTPGLLRGMRDYMTGQSGELSKDDKVKYSSYFKCLPAIWCSSATVEPSTMKFWTDLTGLPFWNLYGATELGEIVAVSTSAIPGSIGKPLGNVNIKLSEGDRGEICVKSPTMFTHYIGDEELTQAAFDEEGYYKTGDLAEFKDGEYRFVGRANADFVNCSIFRFSTLVVENSLMNLPCISEACVLAVPDHEARQLCGALVRLRHDHMLVEEKHLAQIRSDLRSSLAPFMMPILLRVLMDGEELPRTDSGKPLKKQILKDYFGTTDWFSAKNAPETVEQWTVPPKAGGEIKPWDWCGLQLAD